MKKMIRLTAVLLVLALLAGTVSGCTFGEEKKLRERAQAHLVRLAHHADVSDTFTLSDEKVKFSDRTMSVPIKVTSKTYGGDFTVWVSRGEEDTVTDDYYCLYLRQEAKDKINALIEKALGGLMLRASVSFVRTVNPALSLHAAGSVEELMKLAGSEPLIMEVDAVSGEGYNPDDEMVDAMLTALRDAGYWCTFYPYVSSAVWFEIRPEGFWKNRQTGADGGAMMERIEYVPTLPAGN